MERKLAKWKRELYLLSAGEVELVALE